MAHTRPNETTADPNFSAGNIVLLALIFGVAAYATDMYQPAFPAIRQAFATNPEQVQLSLSLFLYGNAIGHLIFGPLSDRYGRKPILMLGLTAYIAATLGCASALSIDSFLLCRALQGGAAAAGPVLVRALVTDRLGRDQAAQMLALLTGMMALLAMLTPVLGGWLVQTHSWRWIFFAIGGLACVVLLASLMLTRETLPLSRRLEALGPGEIIYGYLTILKSNYFWAYVTPAALMFSAVFAYVGVNSFLLIETLGVSAQTQGVYFSCVASAYVAGSFASNRLVHALGVERAVSFGLILGLVNAFASVAASASFAISEALVVIPGLLTFFATALIVPVALSAAVSMFPERAGSASAVAGFTQLSCAGGATALGAWLVGATTVPLHGFTLLSAIIAAAVWFFGKKLRGSQYAIAS